MPVQALEFEAPPPPEIAEEYLPREADSFGEGLLKVLKAAAETLAPAWTEAVRCCSRVTAVLLLAAISREFSRGAVLELAATAASAVLLLEPSAALIESGMETVTQLREYGMLLMAVMASALAARGGAGTSAALYAGTAVFDTILGWAVSEVMLPMLWMFLALAIANGAVKDGLLAGFRDLIRWTMEWALKLTLYIFMGYMTVTGVISGTADALAAKTAKIAISGAVPVVGGILSDASDAVILSASALSGGLGTWGMLTVLAIFAAPVLKLGARYLLLKITAAIGEGLGLKRCAGMVEDFACAMGLLMALVSTQAVLLLISAVCFLRGGVL